MDSLDCDVDVVGLRKERHFQRAHLVPHRRRSRHHLGLVIMRNYADDDDLIEEVALALLQAASQLRNMPTMS